MTKNPPNILTAASDIAKNPKILETVKTLSELPAKPAIIAPTIITDDIALELTLMVCAKMELHSTQHNNQ